MCHPQRVTAVKVKLIQICGTEHIAVADFPPVSDVRYVLVSG